MKRLAIPLSAILLPALVVAASTGATASPADPSAPVESAAGVLDPDALPLEERVSLVAGTSATINSAALYIASAKGYFDDENLDVEVIDAGPAATAQSLLATGRLSAIFGGHSAAFYNGLANGLEVRFVASGGQPRAGAPSQALIAPADGDVHDVESLRGTKIGVPGGVAALSGWVVSELLTQGGLTVDDVEIVTFSSIDEGLAALENDVLSAAITSGPQLIDRLSSGDFVQVGDVDLVLANGNPSSYLFGSTLLDDNPRAGVAFLRALLRATRDDLQGDYLADPEIVQILADAMHVSTDIILATPSPTFDPDMVVPMDVFAAGQAFWRSQGVLTSPEDAPMSDVIDTRLLALALAIESSRD